MTHFKPGKCLAQAFALVALLFLAAAANADDNSQGTKHTLWRIKADRNTVYLLGSLHLLKSSNYPLAEPIQRAFNDSQVLVFELNLGEVDDPAMQLIGLMGKESDSPGDLSIEHDRYVIQESSNDQP